MKKLYRSNNDTVIAGVLGGFSEYIEVDPTIVRLGYILLTLITCFSGILFYVICWIVMPIKVSHQPTGQAGETHKYHAKPENDEKSDVSHETKE
jgi:phage shock protein PspC (stress-responsive transcriptional regulator)